MQPTSNSTARILRLPEVKRRTGLSRSTIYERIGAGDFPKNISLGARSVGWLESEVDEWITRRVESSRNSQKYNSHA